MIAGRLATERAEHLMGHVDDCRNCQSRIGSLQSDDPLSEQLTRLRELDRDSLRRDTLRMPTSPQTSTSSSDSATDPLNTPESPTSIGSYDLIRTIARGGMGTVYEARHRQLGKTFAFKLLHSGTAMTRSQAERIRREWRAHGSLAHPNIVDATDAGIARGQPYLVTERINGLDLAQLTKKRGPLPWTTACELIRQAAVGLQYVHDHGVTHRDVKPSNLMLDSMGTLKVLDLGTAHWRGDDLIHSSQAGSTVSLHGTLAYMAPEQFDRPLNADNRCDIYSLGCTLYYLLCGREPLGNPANRTHQEVIDAHRNETPPPLQSVVPPETTIPPQLQGIVDRMLAKRPTDRFASMTEVIDALEPLCDSDELASLASQWKLEPSKSDSEPLLTGGLTTLLSLPGRRRRGAVIMSLFGAALLALGGWLVSRPSRDLPLPNRNHNVDAGEHARPIESTDSVFDNPVERIRSRSLTPWTAGPITVPDPENGSEQANGSLGGIVLQPAIFDAFGSWQLETIAPRGRVLDMGWSADGGLLAVTSRDGHLRIYNWNGKRLHLTWILTRRSGRFTRFDWHPTEPMLACATGRGLCLVDATTGKIELENSQYSSLRQVQWHPGGKEIGIATREGVVVLAGENLTQNCVSPRNDVWDFAWSPHGDQIIATSLSTVATLHYSGSEFAAAPGAMKRFRRDSACIAVAWFPDGKSVALLRRRSFERCSADSLEVIQATSRPQVASLAMRPGHRSVALGYARNVAIVADGRVVHDRAYAAQDGGRPQVQWNPQGESLAVGINGVVSILDAELKEVDCIGGNNQFVGVRGFGRGSACVMTQNGKVAVIARDGSIRGTTNPSTGSTRTTSFFTLLERSQKLVIRPAFGPRFDSDLPAGSADGESDDAVAGDRYVCIAGDILVYDSEQESWQVLMRNPGNSPTIAASPDSARVVCLDTSGVVTMVSVAEKRVSETWRLQHINAANAIRWQHGANRLLITCSDDDGALVVCLDPDTGREEWRESVTGIGRSIRAVPTGPTTFLHTGRPFKERSVLTGEVTRTIELTNQTPWRHQLLDRANGSDQIHSWSRFSLDNTSNAASPVVCWNSDSLQPTYTLIGVGEHDWATFTAAGQIIDSTPGALDELVWIVQTDTGGQVLSHAEFSAGMDGELRQAKRGSD